MSCRHVFRTLNPIYCAIILKTEHGVFLSDSLWMQPDFIVAVLTCKWCSMKLFVVKRSCGLCSWICLWHNLGQKACPSSRRSSSKSTILLSFSSPIPEIHLRRRHQKRSGGGTMPTVAGLIHLMTDQQSEILHVRFYLFPLQSERSTKFCDSALCSNVALTGARLITLLSKERWGGGEKGVCRENTREVL